ncbi:hypothetical protein HK104_004689, partial [Borealophlyctis nickersoniae]
MTDIASEIAGEDAIPIITTHQQQLPSSPPSTPAVLPQQQPPQQQQQPQPQPPHSTNAEAPSHKGTDLIQKLNAV